MSDDDFDYQAILLGDGQTVSSLIAYQAPARQRLRAVIWSVPRGAWIYAPAIAASYLFDDLEQNLTRPVDRINAETIAVEALKTELPSETTLSEICDEGARMGWDYGPPRQ